MRMDLNKLCDFGDLEKGFNEYHSHQNHTILISVSNVHLYIFHNKILLHFRKECGLEKFVPVFERSTMKGKDLRKLLTQQMKMNQNLTAPGQKHLTALQAKLHYMKIVSEQKTFGSRVFMVTLLVSVSKFY